MTQHDAVNHPAHYTQHPSGVECIAVTEHMNFCLGNAAKHIWRAGDKDNAVTALAHGRSATSSATCRSIWRTPG